MTDPEEIERRIREKAHELWQSEGSPDGRAEAHWQMAKEIIANEDAYLDTLKPLPADPGEPVEPALALENAAPTPGLADQDEEAPKVPTRGKRASSAA